MTIQSPSSLFPNTPNILDSAARFWPAFSDQWRAVQSAECFEGLVIASNSSSFATGAKLEEVAELSGLQALEFARLGQGVLREIALSSIPVVAAIRGFCLGGGLDLARECHGRVAAYHSTFGCPGATLGLLTGWGGTQRLPRLVGTSAAAQMLVTGERVPATQALTLGLVDELVLSTNLVGAAARRPRAIAVEASRSHAPLRSWT